MWLLTQNNVKFLPGYWQPSLLTYPGAKVHPLLYYEAFYYVSSSSETLIYLVQSAVPLDLTIFHWTTSLEMPTIRHTGYHFVQKSARNQRQRMYILCSFSCLSYFLVILVAVIIQTFFNHKLFKSIQIEIITTITIFAYI